MTLENGQKIELKANTSTKHDFESLPILDLEDLTSDDIEKRKSLARELYKDCSEVGFFYVINHHIPQEITDATFEMSKKFFALPEEEKMKVYTGLAPDDQYTGYHPMAKYVKGQRKYTDLREAFNLNYDPNYDPITPPKEKASKTFDNMWPESMPEMKETMMKYHSECLKLGRRMIKLVALAFGLDEDYFNDAVQAPSAGMRILRYPVQEESEEDVNGIRPHTDFQTLTFVNPGSASGLQVLNKSGNWVEAPPIPGALIVNVADCLMRITNDRFVSTIHRVVNTSGGERYSIPFFFGFDYDYKMVPIPSCVSNENPAKYDVLTSAEYVKWRGKTAKQVNIKELATGSA